MVSQILLVIAGLVLVLVGAEALVEGSSSLAKRWGVSEFVIGLTIVALGTSAPEMVVSFIGAAEGNSDIAAGNILGSNIFNTALILGLTALICPVTITGPNRKRDIPANITVTALLIILGLNATLFHLGSDKLSRLEGALFLLLFFCYLIVSFMKDKDNLQEEGEGIREMKLPVSILCIILGLAALVYGGKLFVDSAESVAQMAGLSDKFIAITVLALGTSLPELATSIVAASKGKGQLALGNILGSNTFNILLILGGSALIHPIDMANITIIDFSMVMLCSIYLMIASFTGNKEKLDRAEGAILVLIWLAYMSYLIINL